jgi:hypothetical protein
VVSVVHGGGEANIRLADDIVSEKVSDNGVAFGMASLGEGGKNGSQASRSATTTEDMFSACDKSRSDSPTRKRIPDHKGDSVVSGVLRSRDFEDGKVAEPSTIPALCGLP